MSFKITVIFSTRNLFKNPFKLLKILVSIPLFAYYIHVDIPTAKLIQYEIFSNIQAFYPMVVAVI